MREKEEQEILQTNPFFQGIYRDTNDNARSIFNTKIINTINDLGNSDIFKDYKLLLHPENWNNNDIYIRETYQGLHINISLKTPKTDQSRIVKMGHLQINVLKEGKKIGWLYGELHPHSDKFKFAGLQKTKQDETKVGEQLIDIFLKIIPQLKTQENPINYSTTTEQRKIEVCYLLKKFGFKPKSEKYGNAFEIYKDKAGNFLIYTLSTTKMKGTNKNKFIFLTEKPTPNQDLQFIDKIYRSGYLLHFKQISSILKKKLSLYHLQNLSKNFFL